MGHNKKIQGYLEYMPEKPILLAGPWQGEFGWELMRWQAGIRYLARTGNYDKVICFIQKGHQILYRDFADEICFIARGINTDGWRSDHRQPVFSEILLKPIRNKYPNHLLQIYNPNQRNTLDNENQLFIKFGKVDPNLAYDLIFHARCTGKSKSSRRNWNTKHWNDVARYFKRCNIKMASIGIPEQASHIKFTDNLLGIPLEKLADVFANSKLVIGPSSGPLHLASLCGCTHLVWTDKKRWVSLHMNTNRYRYESYWNPFNTPVRVLDDCNWQPQVSAVIRNVKELLHI